MTNKIKFISKSEWFEFERPLAEPNIKWNPTRATINGEELNTYEIGRIVKRNGDIVWFGQGTNWVKKPNESWTVLGEDENVKPIETYYNPDGSISGFHYPEGRQIWIPCEPPIYETLYQEWLKNQNNPQNGAWLYEKALEEAKNNNLTLDEE